MSDTPPTIARLAVSVVIRARLVLPELTAAQRLELFRDVVGDYCTACGEALEMVDTGPLGVLPRACPCENDE